MTRLAIYSLGLVIFGLISVANVGSPALFAITSGLAVSFAIPLIDAVLSNARWLRLAFGTLRYWRTRVRISASYLYRIRVDNEYLLVKGNRFDQYQPVGGVYKAYPSSSGDRGDMDVLDDDLLVPDAVSEGDLRVRVPGRNLYKFVRWFEGNKGRETDCWREFYEELVVTGVLPKKEFRHVKYERVRRRYNPLRWSDWANSPELLIADVVDLLPTVQQLTELRALKGRPDSRIMWASEDQIRRLGVRAGESTQTTRIAQTALWTIDMTI